MSWDDTTSPDALDAAFAAYDFQAARQLIHGFVEDVDTYARRVPADVAKRVLETIRRAAWFDELVAVARAVGRAGQNETAIRRQLAQGLIEHGDLTAAISELRALRADLDADSPEAAEVIGLLGRAYKQLYVDAEPTAAEPREHDWEEAARYYGEAHAATPAENIWHGLNRVALLAHRARVAQGDAATVPEEARSLAGELLATIEGRLEGASIWDLASRVELLLAQGDNKQAVAATRELLEAQPDRFLLQSLMRQLRELWGLVPDAAPGSHVLPMLTARFAELGGRIEMNPTREESVRLEQVFGDTSYQPLRWLQQAMERARTVARIGHDLYSGIGTGFLFDGAWVGPELAGRKLLLTNAHVCTSDEAVRRRSPYPLPPQDAMVAFFGSVPEGERPEEIAVVGELFTSPPEELDATLLEIASVPEGLEPAPLGGDAVKETDRVNIIGHPHGGTMSVSLQDNQMAEVRDPYLLYRTPTAPGSSGSPIFNQSWQIVGLHHAAAESGDMNEGIDLQKILEAIRARGRGAGR